MLQNFQRCLERFMQMGAVQKCENIIVYEMLMIFSYSSQKMLKNAYLGAKIGFDTEENELCQI